MHGKLRVFQAAFMVFFLAAPIAVGQASDPAGTTSTSDNPGPITGKERLEWVVLETAGPKSLAGGVVSAGWGTLFNTPHEYGTHWEGFGDRYGMRLTGIAVSNTMEAGLGAMWGEDPRYVRDAEAPFGHRIGHVFKMTFFAQNKHGELMPAYARFIAVPTNNFLSNTWRADSEATASKATVRIGLGFLGRLCGNAFDEFWPDVRSKLSRKKDTGTVSQH